MKIKFSCPSCQKVYSVSAELAGKKAKCKQCETLMYVPDAEATEPESPVQIETQQTPVPVQPVPVQPVPVQPVPVQPVPVQPTVVPTEQIQQPVSPIPVSPIPVSPVPVSAPACSGLGRQRVVAQRAACARRSAGGCAGSPASAW